SSGPSVLHPGAVRETALCANMRLTRRNVASHVDQNAAGGDMHSRRSYCAGSTSRRLLHSGFCSDGGSFRPRTANRKKIRERGTPQTAYPPSSSSVNLLRTIKHGT